MPGRMKVEADGHRSVVKLDARIEGRPHGNTPLRAGFVMSWVIAALMVVASAGGLLIRDLYKDGAWAREAARGGDLVSLGVAALLAGTLVLAMRGSARAQAVWVGLLAYVVYSYAFYTFGAKFNDLFLVHIALMSLGIFALACVIPNLDVAAIRQRLHSDRAARWIGGYLVAVGVLQGGLWVFVVLRYIVTGKLLEDIPVAGQHLVFALDLGLSMPALVVGGILLFRGTTMGYLLGAAMVVFGAVVQLNLMVAGAFQDAANVAGVKAFPLESIILTSTFLIAATLVLRGRRAVSGHVRLVR